MGTRSKYCSLVNIYVFISGQDQDQIPAHRLTQGHLPSVHHRDRGPEEGHGSVREEQDLKEITEAEEELGGIAVDLHCIQDLDHRHEITGVEAGLYL